MKFRSWLVAGAAASAALCAALPAQAATLSWHSLLGPEAVGATGTGSTFVAFDTVTHVMRIQATFSGLSGLTTAAHIHCCTTLPGLGTAGVAVDAPSLDIPLGVSAGAFDQMLDLDIATNFSAAFVTASGGTTDLAIARLISNMDAGKTYLNIHSGPNFLGGEIRGFLQIPEPSGHALVLAALALGAAATRRRST